MTKNLTSFEKSIGITFSDQVLLKQALTHKSSLNEDKTTGKSYERLEFLGDAVLEFWISDTLYKLFPQFPEGKLTNLRALSVCTQNLSIAAQAINIGDHLFLSYGEDRGGGRQNPSILEDVFEALVGAIYLDQNQAAAFKFLDQFLLPLVKKLAQKKEYKDPKSKFQEITQAKFNITPHYQTIKETGPDHQKIFKVGVYLGDKLIASGTGKSKQRAEESASLKALKIIDNLNIV